jgi:Uma2 family endonuclease
VDEVGYVQPSVQMRDVWTVEDLGRLEVEDRHRYEIVDGALVVSPTPSIRHEFVVADLRDALLAQLPPELRVLTGAVGIAIGRSYRIPDLRVVRASLRGTSADRLSPADVRLAVEVVSPGSMTMDRVMKPAQYAAAGIPGYWRVETEPVSLSAYHLPAGAAVYAELGTWGPGEIATVALPFPAEIAVDGLLDAG